MGTFCETNAQAVTGYLFVMEIKKEVQHLVHIPYTPVQTPEQRC
jgi:hypothetical protein